MVTVLIPAYNRSSDLQKALHSLCAQTTSDFKVMVFDDASTEDLKSVCEQFTNILDITYMRATRNRGCGGNRRFALEYFLGSAPTEYVMWLDSDDMLLPSAIERMNHIIEHNQADIIITNIWHEYTHEGKNIILADKSRTWLHGKIYRTQFLIDSGVQFPISFKTNEDLAYNLALYAHDPESYLVDEEVYYFRKMPNSITKNIDIFQRCVSTDYIEAIYWAYEHFMVAKHPLDTIMIGNIISCYNYYQRAVVYGYMTEQIKQKMRKMIRNKQVATVLVQLYTRPDIEFHIEQYAKCGSSLVFFGQTLGSWLMSFFKPEEIRELIEKNNLQN